VLDKLPTREGMERTLAELCRAAENLDPILRSFKNDQQLRVGVRDILDKEDIESTTGALADIAEVCLAQIAAREFERLVARFGKPCEWVILALGKFGGREMNYHSDLDVIFLYEADGNTAFDASVADAAASSGRQTTTNQHFFGELGRRIIQSATRTSGYGRLYEVDARLRPTGRSGALATSFEEFSRYFGCGGGQLWERLALCKARVVYGSPRVARAASEIVAQAALAAPWRSADALEARRMRGRLEETAATVGDLKRGPGGLVDIEFLVERLQLEHARGNPRLREPNTLAALEALLEAGLLSDCDYTFFDRSYRLLRTIEGRLRLMNSTARDRLPEDPLELAKLANLLHYSGGGALLADYEAAAGEIRRRFDQLM
jgi:[glutamine synthetase] adenylyltransferase / [glutamine synthetase]-adenylyl-L-tyrosine phosphorylase